MAWLVGAAVVLAGCVVHIVDYKPATGDKTARLLMRGSVSYGETYGIYLFEDPEGCRGMQRVGFGSQGKDPDAVTIDATRLATVDVLFARSGRNYCRVRWSFYPKPGKTYLVRSAFLGERCRVLVFDASDPEKIELEKTSRRRDVGMNVCVPIAETRPLDVDRKPENSDDGFQLPVSGSDAAKRAEQPKLHEKATDEDLKDLIGGK